MKMLIRVLVAWCLVVFGAHAEELPRAIYISPVDKSDLLPKIYIWVKTDANYANERHTFGVAYRACTTRNGEINEWATEWIEDGVVSFLCTPKRGYGSGSP